MRPFVRWSVAFLAAVLAFPPAADAAFVADTVDTVPSGFPNPGVAYDPVTQTPHLGYVSGSGIRHAWRPGGQWQFETVTTNGIALDWVLDPDRLPAAAYTKTGGVLAIATRVLGAWVEDTVVVRPGWGFSVSLAFDPSTREPIVAWATDSTAAPTPRATEVHIARRAAGVWSVALVDSFTGIRWPPSLALDAAGAPRIAYARSSAASAPVGLVYVAGGSTAGPFTLEPVDSAALLYASLALDPASGAPRIAYQAQDEEGYLHIRYAWREGTQWSTMNAGPSNAYFTTLAPVSLVLDAAGSPGFVAMATYNILAQEGAADPAACGGVETGDPYFAFRSSATGFDPFTIEYLPRFDWDHTCGARALAWTPGGGAFIAYRGPRPAFTACAPHSVYSAERAPTADRQSAVAVDFALGAPIPHPARSGERLSVAFTLARADRVGLALHDLAGRRVATRPGHRWPAGSHRIAWQLPVLPPGVYRLSLVTETGLRASRRLIVLR